MGQLLDDPSLSLSLVALLANLVVLGLLYPTLPSTSRTGQLRFLVRFVVIWNIGDMGSRWVFTRGHTVLHMVSEIILLLGMVTVAAMWPHLAWLTTLKDRREGTRQRYEIYQMGLYVTCIVFMLVGLLTRDDDKMLPFPYITVLQVFFLVCLLWSLARYLGPDLKTSNTVEKRSRVILGTASAVMFFFVLNDLILGIIIVGRVDIAILLSPIAMVILGIGYMIKMRYIVGPVKARRKKDEASIGKGMGEGGTRYLLRPGKVYIDLSGSREMGPDIMKDHVGRGRLGMALTSRDPKRFRKGAGLRNLPVVGLLTKGKGKAGKGELDLSSDVDLEMLPVMVEDFAFEVSMVADAQGSIVVMDGLDRLFRVAGGKRAWKALKALNEVAKGAEELRLVLLGSSKKLGKRGDKVERVGFPIRKD